MLRGLALTLKQWSELELRRARRSEPSWSMAQAGVRRTRFPHQPPGDQCRRRTPPANQRSRVWYSSNFSQCRLQGLAGLVGFAEDIRVRTFHVEIPALLVQHVEQRASTKLVRL